MPGFLFESVFLISVLQVQEQVLPFLCLDLSYAHALLANGFKIPQVRAWLLDLMRHWQFSIEAAASKLL